MSDRVIIGITGAFGSGCTFVADEFFVKTRGYKKYSLSSKLKEMFKEKYGSSHKNRRELQDYGNQLRRDNKRILAEKIHEQIVADNTSGPIIIESIRNPAEIDVFRKAYPNFILIALFADHDVRWERVKDVYDNKRDDFDADDAKDKGSTEPEYGQKVSHCFFEADLILSNNKEINVRSHNIAYETMEKAIDNYIKAFTEPTLSEPTIKESLMAITYTIGRRSKCIKRRVGAIIVDESHNILSSGFNAVPRGLDDCSTKLGECYRDQRREKHVKSIAKQIGGSYECICDECKEKNAELPLKLASDIVKTIKVLELCRALHAEESSIINLVGSSKQHNFSNCTLYVTTYPCNLCANKIVQAGIRKVVYFEPYPVDEAKRIFTDAGVETEAFVGVTFRAFFRAFNYEP